jgi:hypothetical protein
VAVYADYPDQAASRFAELDCEGDPDGFEGYEFGRVVQVRDESGAVMVFTVTLRHDPVFYAVQRPDLAKACG